MLNVLPCGDSYQIAMLTGEALSTEMVFPGNPLRVKFDKPTNEVIEWIHREGIGHHWVVCYGDVSAEIRNLASMTCKELKLIECCVV